MICRPLNCDVVKVLVVLLCLPLVWTVVVNISALLMSRRPRPIWLVRSVARPFIEFDRILFDSCSCSTSLRGSRRLYFTPRVRPCFGVKNDEAAGISSDDVTTSRRRNAGTIAPKLLLIHHVDLKENE